jgi:flavin reductase (DIM6/NTAB) family NADH-FMN oxidoreductase RutF
MASRMRGYGLSDFTRLNLTRSPLTLRQRGNIKGSPMDYRIFDADEIDHRQCYRLLIGAIVPRPIAWVSSIDANGVANLAPFSFFTTVSHYPPMVSFSAGEIVKRKKDTTANIEATKGYVIHTVTEGWQEVMNASSANYEPDQDEFTELGLETVPSDLVGAPRIKDCPIAMECTHERTIEFGEEWRTHLVIGRVLRWHVREDLMVEDKYINPQLLQPVGRLGGPRYCKTDEIYELHAPYIQPDVGDPNSAEQQKRKA